MFVVDLYKQHYRTQEKTKAASQKKKKFLEYYGNNWFENIITMNIIIERKEFVLRNSIL